MSKKKKKQPRYRRNPLGFPLTDEDEARMAEIILISKKFMQTYGVYDNPTARKDEQNNTERGEGDTTSQC